MWTRDLLVVALAGFVLSGCSENGGGEGAARDPDAAEASAASGAGDGGSAAAVSPAAPEGFEVSLFHEGAGEAARHLVVRDNGDVLIARRHGMLVALRDADGDGRAERREERQLPITTGLALHDGHLYFSDRTTVSRVALDQGLMPQGEVETLVSGFPEQGQHATKTLALDPGGNLYVNVGAPSNACQEQSRTPGSPGMEPCPQLERQAAIWRFPADTSGLQQSDGERYVTGTRNVVAMDWNPAADALFFVVHGRDQLHSLWPELFDVQDNAEMPAEEFHRAERGADYGWPYTFFDPRSGQRLVAPEYGGDGRRQAEAGRYREPLHAFPAHWAPNDLVFYHGSRFPPRYRGGAFIAWHGSWNRAPLPQEGFRVTFVPFSDGAPSGEPEDFLTGFKAEEHLGDPDRADYRPMGLGVGPNGALYVTETEGGRVWRVRYAG